MAAPESGRRVGPVALDQVLRKDLRSVTPRGPRVDEAIEREVLRVWGRTVYAEPPDE